MQNKLQRYLDRYTTHREIISCNIGSEEWITAKVLTYKNECVNVMFRISKVDLKFQIEYGIFKEDRVMIVDKKIFNR